MDYFDPNGNSISVFDVCHAYQLLETHYNEGGWLQERPSNQRRMESIGCQLARIGYVDNYRTVDLWADDETVEKELSSSDDESVRFVYFKKVLEWGLPLEQEDRHVIERIFTIDAIESWSPGYFQVPPWRPVHVDLGKPWAFRQFDIEIHRPVNGNVSVYSDRRGRPIRFNSWSDASRRAANLSKHL